MKKWNYYNENDPKCCAWIKELISAGLVPDGEVDNRSICDVRADDIKGFIQCHFFAGILGWPLALQLAGWPQDRPIWTGSCPCQPFSGAGKQLGEADERHLWPEFKRLIEKCGPATCIGEQVASNLGRAWLSRVRVDLETMGYGVGAADLCAAGIGQKRHPVIEESQRFILEMARTLESRGDRERARLLRDCANYVGRLIVGAPHIRQRLYWVADANFRRLEAGSGREPKGTEPEGGNGIVKQRSGNGGMVLADGARSHPRELACPGNGHGNTALTDGSLVGLADEPSNRGAQHEREPRRWSAKGPHDTAECFGTGRVANGENANGRAEQQPGESRGRPSGDGATGGVVHGQSGGFGELRDEALARSGGHVDSESKPSSVGNIESDDQRRERIGGQSDGRKSEVRGSSAWSNFYLLPCLDDKARRVESGSFPLVTGLPKGVVHSRDSGVPINPQATGEARVMRLRGYGNSIVPQCAAEFIRAYLAVR